jgi:ferrous iron transport protein B
VTFALVMFVLFTSIFWFSDPLSSGLETIFIWIAEQVTRAPHFWGQELLSQAVLPGISSFLVFVPQILILFFLLSLLEGSGYLARAAFIADSVLLRFGLSGRAFVPLLSGFACAIPALMAARNLSSHRERMITRWIVPLLTCSARIPVFTLLIETLFKPYGAEVKAIGLMGLYLFSLIPAAITAKVLNRFFDQSQSLQTSSFLALDMPWYRLPHLKLALMNSVQKSILFVRRAGPTIFILSVGIYLLSTFPKPQVEGHNVLITESYLGQVANFLEPVFKPMGLDGETGVAILAAFVAREVFVSTLAMVRSVEESDQVALSEVFNMSQALSLMFFFMVALQCLSTVALQAKESGSWRMALSQLVIFNSIAYLGAIFIYQISQSLSF